MIAVDASCVAEIVVAGPDAGPARVALAADTDHVAPHLIDAEVLGVIRRARLRDELDLTAATQAVQDLVAWPAERVDHRPLLARAWELRDTLSAPDALYVALAETLAVPLVTFDQRLARASGLRCEIVVPHSA